MDHNIMTSIYQFYRRLKLFKIACVVDFGFCTKFKIIPLLYKFKLKNKIHDPKFILIKFLSTFALHVMIRCTKHFIGNVASLVANYVVNELITRA